MTIQDNKKSCFTLSNLFANNVSEFKSIIGDEYNKLPTFDLNKDPLGQPVSFPMSDYYDSLNLLTKKILDVYKPSQIIIHEYYMAEEYISKSGQICRFPEKSFVNPTNRLLKKLYRQLKKDLEGAFVIKMPTNVLADENHQWGLHPLHYHKSYYDYAYRSLGYAIKTNDHALMDDLYLSYCSQSCNIYKTFAERSMRNDLEKHVIYTKTISNCFLNYSDILKSIISFCTSNNIRNCAFWGDFIVSEILKSFLDKAGVKVDYIICNWNNHTADTYYPTTLKSYPPTDAIIICNVMAIDYTKEYLKNRVTGRIVSVLDLLSVK